MGLTLRIPRGAADTPPKPAALSDEAYAKMVFLTTGKGKTFLGVIRRSEVQGCSLLMG